MQGMMPSVDFQEWLNGGAKGQTKEFVISAIIFQFMIRLDRIAEAIENPQKWPEV